jgi:phage portal protein BeeE
MSWLLDDLLFFGRAFWWVSSRTADGFPASFTRLPAAMVNTLDMTGPVFAFGTSKQIYFQGAEIPWEDVIQFISPIQGIIFQSPQIVQTALQLQQSVLRNSASSIPSGILKQSSGEPLDAASLGQLAESFNQARLNNQVAALNQYVDYIETKSDPSKMMLMEAMVEQSKEAARLCNIPFFLAGLDVGAYSYNSNKGAREDLFVFGARPYMQCIQETLSMNNVLPNGTKVRFSVDDYLAEFISEEEQDAPEMPEMKTPRQDEETQ